MLMVCKKVVAFGAVIALCLTAIMLTDMVSDDADAAVVDRTVVIGSEEYPVSYYYGTPTLKTTYHIYIASGSDLSILHSTQGTPNRITGTSDLTVQTYTMSNGVSTKKVEGTVTTIGTFTIQCSKASMQSYYPGDIVIHVVQPNNLVVNPGEEFSLTLATMDPAYDNPSGTYFGTPNGPEWITETYNGSSVIITGTAPNDPGVHQKEYYSNPNLTYKRVSVNIEVRELPVTITSSDADADIIVGNSFTRDIVTTPAGATLTINGPSWISVSGSTLVGTPTVAGDYSVTVTATNAISSDTQTFNIHVVNRLAFESVPTGGILATPVI